MPPLRIVLDNNVVVSTLPLRLLPAAALQSSRLKTHPCSGVKLAVSSQLHIVANGEEF